MNLTQSFKSDLNGSEVGDVFDDLFALLVDILLSRSDHRSIVQALEDVIEGTGSVEGRLFPRLEHEGDLPLGPSVLFLQNLRDVGQLVEIGSLASRDEREHVAVGMIDDHFFVLAH